MATIDIKDENFRDTYQNNDVVILDFWAEWCGPCHQFAPIFEELSNEYSDVVFGKVNTEEEQKLAAYFGIRSIPTTLIIRDGLELFRHSGVLDAESLKGVIKQVQDADMDEIRKKIETEES